MKGILVGHAQNEYTGVTAIICPDGAVGGVDVRGGSPGTRETDLLKSENTVEKINAVVLSGGSAFGLEASCGVSKYLYENNIGFQAGLHRVPIVTQAILFDLNDKELHYPDIDMGYQAAKNAQEDFTGGNIGAGRGATVGKILGMQSAQKSGVGTATVTVMGIEITAIIAVNAFGDVFDCDGGRIIKGAKTPDGDFLDTEKFLRETDLSKFFGQNTTIGAVLTDAKITKPQANKLASVAHNGLALSIRPVHTMLDGDTIFTMATGEKEIDFNVLLAAVPQAVRQAVLNAVKE